MTRNERRNLRNGLLFIAPWIVGFLVFTLYPICSSLFFSFCDYSVLERPVWVGTENYTELARDDVFWISLKNTAYYAVFALLFGLILSISIALLLNSKVRGMAFYRTIFFLPSIVPAVASAFLWMWIYNPDYGLANAILAIFGLPPQKWLFDEDMAKPSFIFMGLWGLGASMLIFLAQLQHVPESLHEAAMIDGASNLDRFRLITIPMISPVIFFNLVVGIIGSFQIFTTAFIATQGGPNNATLFYVLHLYNNGFQFLHMGYASALAWVLFTIILVFTGLQLRLANRWVYYEGEARR